MPEPPHFRRILILWAALSIIATPIVVLVFAPDLPPGNGANAASGQVTDNTVLLGIQTPIAALLIVYFAYALIVFRRHDDGPDEGVAIRGNTRHPDDLAGRHLGGRALPGDLRNRPALRRGLRRRAGRGSRSPSRRAVCSRCR